MKAYIIQRIMYFKVNSLPCKPHTNLFKNPYLVLPLTVYSAQPFMNHLYIIKNGKFIIGFCGYVNVLARKIVDGRHQSWSLKLSCSRLVFTSIRNNYFLFIWRAVLSHKNFKTQK